MKLTDFCMIFAALFVCMFLGRDLHIEGLLVQKTSQVMYNRQMDRIAEDALMDVTETEWEDGRLDVRTDQMQQQYEKLLSLSFELTDDDCHLRAWEAVTLWQFGQYPYDLSAQELDALRADMEKQINNVKHRRREATQLAIALPYVSQDDWYQTIAGPQLLTSFDPREPFRGVDRTLLSGSRIRKLRGR
ncbi:MAG: hypothetical protein MSA09_09975 [Lachnospiraceae bacterium]|nr:hypothetical protein [Lachnospiraceae bacterium]MDD7176898.1 hypothetical protein [bacterium]MDY5517702.1 hypothetical protein [Lachnospiraceae bacterium]